MPSALDYYGQYNPESSMDWNGFKSNKFGRTRKHFMPKDTIRSSTPFYLSRSRHVSSLNQVGPQTLRIKTQPIKTVQIFPQKSISLALGAQI
jgi:hypothetical protein